MTNDTTHAMPTVEEISELADLVDSTCWGEESRHDAAVMLRAIADHLRKSEPKVWMIRHIHTGQLSWIVDEQSCVFPDSESAARQCETINDDEDSDVWEVFPLYITPLADAEDARRYRWLCQQGEEDGLFIASGSTGTWGECGHSDWQGMKNALDERIDDAMKEDSHG